MIQSLTKTLAVVVSTTVLSTLAVNAMDVHGAWVRTMLGALVFGAPESTEPCPSGMQLVTAGLEPFCVDTYENAAAEACPYTDPTDAVETEHNLLSPLCSAVSAFGRMPWRFVRQEDAARACARAGKRLPTAREWYLAAAGTDDARDAFKDDSCNVARNRADGVARTGGGMRCVSDVGAYDMVGNVWEWVSEHAERGVWNERRLPISGPVAGVDLAGVAFETGAHPARVFADDRITVDAAITAGIMRGGYYDGRETSGVYALYAASPAAFAGEAVGFRCVTDVRDAS